MNLHNLVVLTKRTQVSKFPSRSESLEETCASRIHENPVLLVSWKSKVISTIVLKISYSVAWKHCLKHIQWICSAQMPWISAIFMCGESKRGLNFSSTKEEQDKVILRESQGEVWCLTVALRGISLMANNVEHIFVFLLATHTLKYLFKSHVHYYLGSFLMEL